jgi:hypothetical protein
MLLKPISGSAIPARFRGPSSSGTENPIGVTDLAVS